MTDEQDTVTRAARDLRELVGDDEYRRRQSLIEAIGIAEFASVEWTVIVNHVRLMRENWDRFVADAASYKKRLDRELQAAQAEGASWKQAHAELNADLQAVRGALQARDDEATLDAAKRWVSTAMNEAALLNDIDEARGMLCSELVMDDPGNTMEVMRQAALAIARHRLSTETLSKIRAELAASEAKPSSHGSGVTDHSQCGLGTIDDGPRDSDCPCRTGAALSACAAAGCGFCRAEVSLRTPAGTTSKRDGR